MKPVLLGVIVIFLVFYVMTSPDNAANMVHGGWDGAVNVAHGLGHFVDKLAQ
ncbi:MAG: hypothetical protein QOE97_3642 [Pseudonocardiales bacterium]|jgi:hypothetical protein|nr:hypothetical protein [Pseudonocardiales bacterium]